MAEIDLTKLPKNPTAIQKVAHKEYQKRASKNRRNGTISYKEGDPLDKVWDNYQLTKELKRQFKELCAKKNINASKYIRACIKILIKKEGDLTKAGKEVQKVDATSLPE